MERGKSVFTPSPRQLQKDEVPNNSKSLNEKIQFSSQISSDIHRYNLRRKRAQEDGIQNIDGLVNKEDKYKFINNVAEVDDPQIEPLALGVFISCNACGQEVDEQYIRCDGDCESWFHLSCTDILEDESKRVQSENWECHTCANKQSLPSYRVCNEISDKAVWGILKGKELFRVVNKAYEEVMKWNRNLFMPPTGQAGQQFIMEITRCITNFNDSTYLEPIALKMALLCFPLLLQKPSKNSKSRDHVKCLEERLKLWSDGKVEELLRKGRVVQRNLLKSKSKTLDSDKMFDRNMKQGKVSAALRWIGDHKSSVHKTTPDVIRKLKNLHPPAKRSTNAATLNGPIDKVESETYAGIDAELIQQCIKHIKGAAGPSGADAELWLRILCSKQFKKKPLELCKVVAELAKKLASEYVDPNALDAFNACRLIPLVKDIEGVRPVGIGEILHRIVAKSILKVVNSDIIDATTPIQICSGVPSGVEAAVHAVREIYEDTKTEAILLVDAANAFNSMNRSAALKNIQITCPQFATFLINTYRSPARLHVRNSDDTIMSDEGTTQGDVAAMSFYSCSTMPLIHNLGQSIDNTEASISLKQIWYADDSAAGGTLDDIKVWWNKLQALGPRYGYYPKANKTWLIVKPEYEKKAREMYPELVSVVDGITTNNITKTGRKYLGSFIGTDEGKQLFIKKQMESWKRDIVDLARIGLKEPQLAYSAFVYGTSKRWNYVCRTTPNISDLLGPLEDAINETLLPVLVGKAHVDKTLRKMMSFPAKHGGMNIPTVTEVSDREYNNSLRVTRSITKAIIQQDSILELNFAELLKIKEEIKKERLTFYAEKKQTFVGESSETIARILELASEKGVSCWLTTLPLEVFGFTMNKQEFHDAIALRYNLKLSDVSGYCFCGEKNTINHSLTCKKGGYTHLRHNSLRDTIAELLSDVCKDVVVEPHLLELSGEKLPKGTITTSEARLDISARGFWSQMDKIFTDVRVFHPHAPSNTKMSVQTAYQHHEYLKKRAYNARVLQVEKASFTPLVFSTTGGMGNEATRFVKRLAMKMSQKEYASDYSQNVSFLRRRLRFDLLKTTLISLRGFRGKNARCQLQKISELDVHLHPKAYTADS